MQRPQPCLQQLLAFYPIPFLVVTLVVLLQRPDDPHAWLLALMLGGYIAGAGMTEFEYRIPLASIESVTQGMTSRSLNKTRSVVDGTLVLEVSNSTNVRLLLNEPQQVDLGRRGVHEVTKIEFWTDSPDEMVRALRK